ncbi:hypothetical protein BGZ74_006641 [Mortierella antarctica]|nr:hypothetical protein BGZ74_006641 [Mortierella antarctica]
MYAYLGLGGDFICGVTFCNSFKKRGVDWLNLRRQLDRYFASLVQLRQATRKNVAIKIRDLSGALKPFLTAGLKGIDLFCWKTSKWQMHFAVVDGVVRGPSNATYPPKLLHQAVLRHGTLQRLTVCTMHPTEVVSLRELVDCNPGIYWIDIWFFRHELLSGIASIYQHWYGDPTELHIAVFEKGGKNEFRAVTKITIGNQTIAALEALHTGDQYNTSTPHHGQQRNSKELTYLMSFQVSRWTVDHPVGILNDHTAALLDIATRQHPNVLTAFTLDISSLSRLGLVSIRNLFQQSNFSHLHVKCVSFDPPIKRAVGQVLDAAPWLSIRSLVLSGVKIEYWIRMWPSRTILSMDHGDLSLLSLGLVGSSDPSSPLSHSSVLTLHRWIYGTKLLDLSVEAIQLEDEGDWELILGVCNFSVLKTLSLCGTSIAGSKRLKRLLGAQYTRLTTVPSKEILSVEIVRRDKATTLCGRLWSTEIPEMLRPKKAKAQGF